MKKIVLLSALAGLIFHTAANAQSFVTEVGDTSSLTWSTGSTLKVYNRLKSSSSTPVTLRWRVTNHFLPSGWFLTGLCDNIQCHASATTLSNIWKVTNPYGPTINPAAIDNDFHIEFADVNTGANGTAVFRFQVQDINDTMSQKFVTFIGIKNPTGVVNIIRSEDEVVVYPNPARGSVNVLFSPDAGVKNIALYNLIGKPVMVYRLQSNSSARLELDHVPSGVYFLRLLDARGHVVATRRFTHQ